MEVAIVSEKGMRPTMEDAHFVDSDFAGKGWLYAGIYDGHGGEAAAEYASQNLSRIFRERLLSGLPPAKAFMESYQAVSDQMNELDSGTTSVDVLIREGKAYAANVGDARAIVVGRKGVQQLTVDHRLDNPDERQRVERMGGRIWYPYTYRGVQGIMPTRTLGDSYFKPVGIIATPSVGEYEITDDDFLLLAACDGLFDFMENEEIARLAREYISPESLLEALKHEILVNRLGTDNLTMVAVSLAL
ncbi:MAG TPA: protein serine/threonine phosphatase 2C family protein [Dehalococcoidia bacterium]|nr:protein serine/threonine phosphatase 2C family protein [Dehalococcoidia bacterium]